MRTTMASATYAGPHPVEFGEQVSYYVSYRPFSPMVLLLLFSVALAGSVGENGAPPFRVGFSTSLFTDVNDADSASEIAVRSSHDLAC